MRLRLLPALMLALVALGASAGSSSSAAATPSIDPFLGDWTMTADADDPLAGYHLVIKESTAYAAKVLVGPEWTNASGTAWYDTHCGSTATVYAYVVLTYTWGAQGSMGGCLSDKTVPHVVFAGSAKEAGSVRVATSAKLDQLTGKWDTIDGINCCVHHDVHGVLPSVSFTVGEQGHRALPKKKNGPKFLLTRLLGLGAVSLGAGGVDSDGVYDARINDATGKIHFHKWRIFEHGVVDEDLLVLGVQKANKAFYRKAAALKMVYGIGVVVKKADPDQTDPCRVGATGTLTMISQDSGKDIIFLTIARCHVDETFGNGLKGAKVAVGLTDNKP